MGLFGSSKDTVYNRLVPFQLGSDKVEHFPLVIEARGSKNLLGMRYLENYRVVMNWPQKRMYFQRTEDYDGRKYRTFKVVPIYKDSALVTGIVVERLQPELQSNLGDTLVRVNGIHCFPATPELYCEVLNEFRDNDTLRVAFKNREEVDLVLEKVFSENR